MKPMKLIVVLLSCFLVGCSYNQDFFRLNPTLYKATRAIGQGEKVAVVVEDQRPQSYLGVHWLGVGAANKINLANDLQEQTRLLIEQSLRDRGFSPTSNTHSDTRRLFVRILSYTFNQKLAVLGTTADVRMEISVTAQNGPDEYTKNYMAEEVQDIIPSIESQEEFRQITRVYQKAFNEMLADPNIWLTFTRNNATEAYPVIEDEV